MAALLARSNGNATSAPSGAARGPRRDRLHSAELRHQLRMSVEISESAAMIGCASVRFGSKTDISSVGPQIMSGRIVRLSRFEQLPGVDLERHGQPFQIVQRYVALAALHCADEYDAAQDRGEVRSDRQHTASNLEAVGVADIGLTHKGI